MHSERDGPSRGDWSWRDGVIFTSGAQLTSAETLLRQGGYGLLSGKIELNLTDPDISIAVVGRNLADKDYLSGGGDLRSLGIAIGYPGEPRYLGVQVTKRWQ